MAPSILAWLAPVIGGVMLSWRCNVLWASQAKQQASIHSGAMPNFSVDSIFSFDLSSRRFIRKRLYAPPPQTHIFSALWGRVFNASQIVCTVNSNRVRWMSIGLVSGKKVRFFCNQSALKYSRPVLLGWGCWKKGSWQMDSFEIIYGCKGISLRFRQLELPQSM